MVVQGSIDAGKGFYMGRNSTNIVRNHQNGHFAVQLLQFVVKTLSKAVSTKLPGSSSKSNLGLPISSRQKNPLAIVLPIVPSVENGYIP